MNYKKISKVFSYIGTILKNPKLLKYTYRWIKFSKLKSSLEEEIPWITFESKEYIDSKITNNFKIFEWGSGGSTIYFSKTAKKVFSVEHDKHWHEDVKKYAIKRNINNLEYTLILPEELNCNLNKNRLSTDLKFLNNSFNNYCDEINRFPDKYFDIIFIDGRARNGCIKNSINKIKDDGFIILDNSERKEYEEGKLLLSNFKKTSFFGPGPFGLSFTETSIFKL